MTRRLCFRKNVRYWFYFQCKRSSPLIAVAFLYSHYDDSSVYSIDAGLPFARELAAGVIKLAASPERLAGALILLPSRRAAALFKQHFGWRTVQPMLLPRMLPVGDFGNDDDGRLSPFLGDDAGCDLPPPISKIRRQICLAKLLRYFPLGGQYPSQPQAMRLAASLGQLLDQLYNADASAEQLRDLLPNQFSAHWQDILILLRILIDRWPGYFVGRKTY